MDKTKKIIATLGILSSLMGGSFYAGSERNRPDCDFVIVTEDKEICLTSEQVEAIKSQIEMIPSGTGGFGGVRFGKPLLNLKENAKSSN